MKQYTSHKTVHAAKIVGFTEATRAGVRGVALLFENGSEHSVDAEYMDKHRPMVGGYYVKYADGYESYSPAEPFETGYTEAGTPAPLPAQKPSIGRAVHYVAFGTPGGEFPVGVCRAADITEVHSDTEVGLMVKNPGGIFFNQHVEYDPSGVRGGTWHWPERV